MAFIVEQNLAVIDTAVLVRCLDKHLTRHIRFVKNVTSSTKPEVHNVLQRKVSCPQLLCFSEARTGHTLLYKFALWVSVFTVQPSIACCLQPSRKAFLLSAYTTVSLVSITRIYTVL